MLTDNTFTNPYWVVNKGWSSYNPIETYKKYKIETEQLEVGNICLIYKDGVLVESEVLNIEEVFDEIHTYNFYVEDNNNYFAENILVHNKFHGGGGWGGDPMPYPCQPGFTIGGEPHWPDCACPRHGNEPMCEHYTHVW